MADFPSLTCPACGAKLKVTDDRARFICDYCGNEQLVDGTILTVARFPSETIDSQKSETAKESPSELATQRLRQEIADLEVVLEEIGMVDSPLGVAICTI
jgi:uncharacterized Zn finger protein (UPF0148 family)